MVHQDVKTCASSQFCKHHCVFKFFEDFTGEKKAFYLKQFLEERAKSHPFLYHYTSFETLKLILENQCIQFTNGLSPKLNDQHVKDGKGNPEVREHLYIACFTFREDESIAMWQIYGKNNPNVVRIQIPMKNINTWITNLRETDIWRCGISL